VVSAPGKPDSPPPRGRACRFRVRLRSVPISGVDPPLSPTTAREGRGPAGRPPDKASWPLQVRGSTQCIRAAPGDSQAQATRVPSRGQAGQIRASPRPLAPRGPGPSRDGGRPQPPGNVGSPPRSHHDPRVPRHPAEPVRVAGHMWHAMPGAGDSWPGMRTLRVLGDAIGRPSPSVGSPVAPPAAPEGSRGLPSRPPLAPRVRARVVQLSGAAPGPGAGSGPPR
jgi:hypothetical protein